jgi:hypothetical protein
MLMVVTDPPEVVIVAVADAPLPEPASVKDTVGAEVYPAPKVLRVTVKIFNVVVASAAVPPFGTGSTPSRIVTLGADA